MLRQTADSTKFTSDFFSGYIATVTLTAQCTEQLPLAKSFGSAQALFRQVLLIITFYITWRSWRWDSNCDDLLIGALYGNGGKFLANYRDARQANGIQTYAFFIWLFRRKLENAKCFCCIERAIEICDYETILMWCVFDCWEKRRSSNALSFRFAKRRVRFSSKSSHILSAKTSRSCKHAVSFILILMCVRVQWDQTIKLFANPGHTLSMCLLVLTWS